MWVRGQGDASSISLTFPEVDCPFQLGVGMQLPWAAVAGVKVRLCYCSLCQMAEACGDHIHSHYLKIIICSYILVAMVYVIFQAISLEDAFFAFKLI